MVKHIINDISAYKKERRSDKPNSFYKLYSKKLNKISFLLSIFSFIFITFGHYNILDENKKERTFLTNIYGQTENYYNNERRNRAIQEFIDNQNKINGN